MGFTCSVCGEHHDELLRDIRADVPDAVFELPEEERAERARVGSDSAQYVDAAGANHLYTRGVIHVPIQGADDEFRFGVWVEVAEADFTRLGELWHDPEGWRARPVAGTLANELTLYDGSRGLGVSVQLSENVNLLPRVEVGDAPHPLARDQREGITEVQAQRLAESVLH